MTRNMKKINEFKKQKKNETNSVLKEIETIDNLSVRQKLKDWRKFKEY